MPFGRAALFIFAIGAAVAAAVVLLPGDDEPQAPPGGPRFGFNELRWSVGWQSDSDEPLIAAVEVAEIAGADTARMIVPWFDVIDPTGAWDESAWSRYRDAYEALSERGIRPVVTLVGAPRGAAGVQDDPDWAQPGCFAGFAVAPAPAYDAQWEAVVLRATNEFDQALAIQVWNEPNSPDYWGGCQPDPGRYLELVELAQAAIARSEHPGRKLVSAGLNPSAGTAVVAWQDYLAALVAGGLLDHVHAVGLHPYPVPEDCDRPEGSAPERLAAAVGAQVDEAIGLLPPGTPIWVTEFGASSAAGLTPDCRALTEEEQAETLLATYGELRSRDQVKTAIVHQLVDDRDSTEEFQNHFGVTRERPFLAPKLAFSCLAERRAEPESGCSD